MNFVVSLLVGLDYAFTLDRVAGLVAGMLVAFALFALRVATFPIYPETLGQRLDRERFGRGVALLVLVTAIAGLGLSRLLLG